MLAKKLSSLTINDVLYFYILRHCTLSYLTCLSLSTDVKTSFNQANDELREYCSVFSKFEQARKATHNYCWSFSWLTFQLAWFHRYRALSGNTGQGFLVMRLIISLFISASMAFTSLSLRNNFLVQLNCWAWLVVCELCSFLFM